MSVLPFVAQFAVSNQNFVNTLSPHIGNKYPRDKFAPPSDKTKADIQTFMHALTAYEASPDDSGLKLLNSSMQALHLGCIRLQEEADNCVIFYPTDIHDNHPIVCGGVLTYRFGVSPTFVIFDPHSGQDGTKFAVTAQFMAGAKALLSHAFNPNCADNPNFKGNPITASNIRRFADPAHSNTTAFVPFINAMNSVWNNAFASTVTHGMVGHSNFQLIGNNDYAAHFIHPDKSWCALLTIALALQDCPVNPNVFVVEGSVPGFIVKNGVKSAIISTTNRNSPIRLNNGIGDNTDCVGHMANGANAPFQYGKQTDRSMFMELGGTMRGNGNHLMQLFVKAQSMAIDWYAKYDPAIHNPWGLAQNFPDVYNDMSLYPNLFDAKFIADYKASGINPYTNQAPTPVNAADISGGEQTMAQDLADNNLTDNIS